MATGIIVINAARLSPYLARGRGYPVARWRGQHVGGGGVRTEVEIVPLRNAGGGQTGACAEARGTCGWRLKLRA